jgi:hypothetical protein
LLAEGGKGHRRQKAEGSEATGVPFA